MASFPSNSANRYNAVPGETYRFQGALLEADTPALSASNSNQVATIGYVSNLVNGSSSLPIVERATNRPLGIVVSSGTIEHEGATYTVPPKSNPISVLANTQEYVWYRFLDSEVVVSMEAPDPAEGIVIARVSSNDAHIININQSTATLRWADVDSPTFLGEPKVPTPDINSDTKQISNTEWVNDKLDELRAEIMAQVLAEVKDKLTATYGGEIVDKL